MNIKVKYFGMIAESVGISEEVINIDPYDGSTFDVLIKERYPQLVSMNYKIALNQTISGANMKLKDNDEIAILPPFAGG